MTSLLASRRSTGTSRATRNLAPLCASLRSVACNGLGPEIAVGIVSVLALPIVGSSTH